MNRPRQQQSSEELDLFFAGLIDPEQSLPEVELEKRYLSFWEGLSEEQRTEILRRRDNQGRTLCHLLVEKGLDELLEEVLVEFSEGELSACVDAERQNILHVAADRRNNDLLTLLVEQAPQLVKERDLEGNTPLHLAVKQRGITSESLERMVEAAPDDIIRVPGELGALPLALAKDEETASYLRGLTEPESDERLNLRGDTLLHLAAAKGWTELVDAILDSDLTDTAVTNECGQTPLHVCATDEIAEKLWAIVDETQRLELVTCRDESGNTPIHRAAEAGWSELVQQWLDAAGETTSTLDTWRGTDGCTPLHCAITGQGRGGWRRTPGRIEALQPEPQRHRPNETSTELSNVIDSLLDAAGAGAERLAKSRDDKGYTALHRVCEKSAQKKFNIIERLLEAAPDILELRNGHGERPLHLAANGPDEKIVEHLCDRGAVVDAIDERGTGVLHRIRGRGEESGEIARILLDAGAQWWDPNPSNGASVLADTDNEEVALAVLDWLDESGSADELHDACTVIDAAGHNILHGVANKEWPRVFDKIEELFPESMLTKLAIRGDAYDARPIHLATDEDIAERLWELMVACGESTPLFAPDYTGTTPIHVGAANGWSRLIERWRESYPFRFGRAARRTDDKRQTALHIVAGAQLMNHSDGFGRGSSWSNDHDYRVQIADSLLPSFDNADLRLRDLTDVDGRTVLHVAASEGYSEIAEFFAKRDKGLLACADFQRLTPLHYCARSRSRRGDAGVAAVLGPLAKKPEGPLDAKGPLDARPVALAEEEAVAKELLPPASRPVEKGDWSTEVNGREDTLLHIAAARGWLNLTASWAWQNSPEDVRECLSNSNVYGQTPLHVCNSENMARMLWDRADLASDGDARELLTRRDVFGSTPIHRAAQGGWTEQLDKWLTLIDPTFEGNSRSIHEGTDRPLVCLRGQHGDTPLHLVMRAEERLRRQRRDGGMDPLAPRHRRRRSGRRSRKPERNDGSPSRVPALEVLLSHLDRALTNSTTSGKAPISSVNLRNDRGWTPLMEAASKGDARAIERLLAYGAAADLKDDRGRTALHIAADQRDSIEAVEVLAKASRAVNSTDDRGQTPLHLACSNDEYGSACKLIGAGADVNAQDYFGRTPLFELVSSWSRGRGNEPDRQTLCTLFREYGVDPTIRDLEGQTAFFEVRQLHWLRWLVELSDGDVPPWSDRDLTGTTLLHRYLGEDELVEYTLRALDDMSLFRSRDHRGRTPIHEAVRGSMPADLLAQLADRLQKAGEEDALWIKDYHGQTPAHECREDHIRTLIKTNEDWLNQDYSGRSVLAARAEHGCNISAYLMRRRHGARDWCREALQSEDHKGRTLLHAACDRSNQSWIDVALLCGGEPNREDDRGQGPVHIAVEANSWQDGGAIIRRLLEAGADPTELDRDEKTAMDRVVAEQDNKVGRRRWRPRSVDYGIQRALLDSSEGVENLWMPGRPAKARIEAATRSGCDEILKALLERYAVKTIDPSLYRRVAERTELCRENSSRRIQTNGTGRLWEALTDVSNSSGKPSRLQCLLDRRYSNATEIDGQLNGEDGDRQLLFELIATPEQLKALGDITNGVKARQTKWKFRWPDGPVTDTASCEQFEEEELKALLGGPRNNPTELIEVVAENVARYLVRDKHELIWRAFLRQLPGLRDKDRQACLNKALRLATKHNLTYFVRRFFEKFNGEFAAKAVNARGNDNGRTPIFFAGDPATVNTLIRQGADLVINDESGFNPIYAWVAGRAERLLRQGRSHSGSQRRRRSTHSDRMLAAMIGLVLEYTGAGRALAVPGRNARNVFHEVARLGSPEIFNVMLAVLKRRKAYYRLRSVDDAGNTPMHYAASPSIIELVVTFFPSLLKVRNDDGEVPLETMIRRTTIEDVVDAYERRGRRGGTRTQAVIPGRNRLDLVVHIHQTELTPDIFEASLEKIFCRACEAGAIDEVIYILDQVGYDPVESLRNWVAKADDWERSSDDNGRKDRNNHPGPTAIHAAAFGGSLRALAILGAHLSGEDKSRSRELNATKSRVYTLARTEFADALSPFFCRADRFGNTPLHYAAVSRDYWVLKLVAGVVSEVNVTNAMKLTPLHLLAMSTRFDPELHLDFDGRRIFEELVSNGADLSARDGMGRTMLDLLLREDDLEIFKGYIDHIGGGQAHQFDPNMKVDERRKETILHKIAFHQGGGGPSQGGWGITHGKRILQFLQEHYYKELDESANRLDPNVRDASGDTPLMIAVRMNMKTEQDQLTELGDIATEPDPDGDNDDDKDSQNGDPSQGDKDPDTSKKKAKTPYSRKDDSRDPNDPEQDPDDDNTDDDDDESSNRLDDEANLKITQLIDESAFTHRSFIKQFVETFEKKIDYAARDSATRRTELQWCVDHGDFESAETIARGWWKVLTQECNGGGPAELAENMVEQWCDDADTIENSSAEDSDSVRDKLIVELTVRTIRKEVEEILKEFGEDDSLSAGELPVIFDGPSVLESKNRTAFITALPRLDELRNHLQLLITSIDPGDTEQSKTTNTSDNKSAAEPALSRLYRSYLLWRSVTPIGSLLRWLRARRLTEIIIGPYELPTREVEIPPALCEQRTLLSVDADESEIR